MRKMALRGKLPHIVTEAKSKSRGGRPTREEVGLLTERLIEAGTLLFFEHGYESTSIERIAREAGVSKRTFYSRFPTKADVFEAVVERWLQEEMVEIEAGTPEVSDVTAEEWLIAVGLKFLEVNLRSKSIEFVRMMISSSRDFPEISLRVNQVCHTRVKILLKSALEKFHERGEIDIEDASFATTMFMHSCIGYLRDEAMMGRIKPQIDSATRIAFLKSVDFFLRGCRAKAI